MLLFVSISILMSCKKDPVEVNHYELKNQWGQLGVNNGEFNRPSKIEITKDFIFVNDIGNNAIFKFNKNGDYINKLDFSAPFYIFDDTLYILNSLNKSSISKYDLNLNFISEKLFHTSFYGVTEITGNSQNAIATTNLDSCFVIGIDYKTNAIKRGGTLGTDNFEFNWNGNLIPAMINDNYLITDPDNRRLQMISKNLEFISLIDTDIPSNPNVMAVNSKYIAVSNSTSGEAEIRFFDINSYKKIFSISIDGFVGCIGFYENELYVLQTDIGVVKVYSIN